jgi:hypothetical protein
MRRCGVGDGGGSSDLGDGVAATLDASTLEMAHATLWEARRWWRIRRPWIWRKSRNGRACIRNRGTGAALPNRHRGSNWRCLVVVGGGGSSVDWRPGRGGIHGDWERERRGGGGAGNRGVALIDVEGEGCLRGERGRAQSSVEGEAEANGGARRSEDGWELYEPVEEDLPAGP